MLRKALGETGGDQRFITTVPGRGYRFVAEVKRVSGNHHQPDLQTVPVVAEDGSGTTARLGRSGALLAAIALLVIMSVAGYFAWWRPQHRSSRANGRKMLAVLPVENLTGDARQEYFSDGLTEEMINQLGRLDPQHLGVIARTSVMHYKSGHEQLGPIARELGVDYVLEGSFRRESGKVRITAQLIQTRDQTHVWAREYDRELTGLLALQGEIAREVADEIQLTLGDHKQLLVARPPTPSPTSYEAYDLYLKGRYFWNKRTVEGFHQAINQFQQAIAKDPNYARPYAGLADSYALLNSYSAAPLAEFMPKARAAALKALELDERLAEVHTSLALIAENYDWDWQTAEKEYRRAIELDSNYATAHHWYAEYLAWQGRFDEAFRESERARQLDPLSLIIAADNGVMLYYSRQYDRAIEKFRTVREMDANFPRAGMIVSAYVQKGMFAEALADIENGRRVYGDSAWIWSTLAYVYGRSGQRVQARHALAKLEQMNRHQPLDPAPISWAYLGMGNKDQAFAWLERAYSQHSFAMTALKVEPAYDPLRSDPRFQDLMRRVGLAQ